MVTALTPESEETGMSLDLTHDRPIKKKPGNSDFYFSKSSEKLENQIIGFVYYNLLSVRISIRINDAESSPLYSKKIF